MTCSDTGTLPDWVDVPTASRRTGFDASSILRLIEDGTMPVMQLAGPERTSHRLPRQLIEDARAAVMAGGQVELRDFARTWAARNATEVS